jgi:hypothetical protein
MSLVNEPQGTYGSPASLVAADTSSESANGSVAMTVGEAQSSLTGCGVST